MARVFALAVLAVLAVHRNAITVNNPAVITFFIAVLPIFSLLLSLSAAARPRAAKS